ncbi:hypothetical protein AWJ20_1199 [Sugiyamaella lignohabitans]|uniref:Translocon-associated protein subunit alpha n=1 Tax=Sugiyamaella lignohabitans TaxID=796027 RepID=A0A167DHC8_9ASCO|nr:uncharacterized protein AWJ20_1199 [Sugiyamaella lignohabitans]ANB12921.1 hypothetical protein AWJ20_1199 [Sugiyamaella lignohabitans]
MKLASILSSFLALGSVAFAAGESATENKEVLKVDVQFPDEYIKDYGVELINDVETPVKIYFTNGMPAEGGLPFVLAAVGGSVFEKENPDKVFTNLTIAKIGPVSIGPGETKLVTHSLKFNLPPKEFNLGFVFYLQHDEEFFSFKLDQKMPLFIADPPISSFDPRLILVQIITGVTVGFIGYFLTKTYVAPVFDRLGDKKKKPAPVKKAAAPVEKDEAASSGYDESWIPEHHLKTRSSKK